MSHSSRLRLSVTSLLLCIVLGAVAPARAEIATAGTLVISAERLFGLSFNNVTTSTDNGDVSTSRTDFGLLWGSTTNVYMIPRVGVDYLVIDGLTVGGGLGFFVSSNDAGTVNGITSVDTSGPTSTRFLVAPRVGWAHGIAGRVGVWLRGGLTYYYGSISSARMGRNGDTTVSYRSTGLGLNLEPALMVALTDHFAFSAGPVFDLPLTGSRSQEVSTPVMTRTTSYYESVRNLGLVVNLVGYF
jgi:hypothetical protein